MLSHFRASRSRPSDAVGVEKASKASKLVAQSSPRGKCAHDTTDDDECDGDEVCYVCHSAARAASMLLCDGDGCSAALHMACANPPMRGLPRGDWFCPECDPYASSAPRARAAWLLSPTKPSAGGATAPGEEGETDGSLRGGRGAARALAAAKVAALTASQAERAVAIRRLRLAARDLHYSSTPAALLCRVEEFEAIMRFIRDRVAAGRGGGLYVSGTPGNGKSVTINLVRERLAGAGADGGVGTIALNAFAFVDAPHELYTALDRQLSARASAPSPAHARQMAGALSPSDRGKAAAQAALARLEARFAPASAPTPTRRAGVSAGAIRSKPDAAAAAAPMVVAKAAAGGGASSRPAAAARACAPRVCVVFVDEIDSLYEAAAGDDVLCRLFEWAALPASPLVLVGIANAIDLTERMLPALARRGCTPNTLTFRPYQPDDIVKILEERLARAPHARRVESAAEDARAGGGGARAARNRGGAAAQPRPPPTADAPPTPPTPPPADDGEAPIISRQALEFCARKVCAASSDARRALDICRGALELVLSQLESDVEAGAAAAGGAGGAVGVGGAAAAAPAAVSVPVMARAVGVLFNSRVVELCASLPQHQQLFMCAAVLHFREEAAARAAPRPAALLLAPVKRVEGAGASGRTTVRKLYQAYATLCRAQQVRPISLSEIVPACQALASSGMLHIAAPGKRKAGAAAGVHDGGALDSTVSLAIQESELQLAVKEVRFFRQILQPAPSAQPGAQPGAQQGAHPSTQP